ncbi:MAG: magnesium transporter CorA family protein [Gammaproteobacteria bacterium]
MIETVILKQDSGFVEKGQIDLLSSWKDQDNALVWINLTNPSSSEDELIANSFGFNTLEMADATRLRHPPKVEFFDDHFLVLLRTVDFTDIENEIDYSQLAVFVSEHYIVTRKLNPHECVDDIWNSLLENEIDCLHGTSHIAYLISRRVADQYFRILEMLEERLEELENLLTTDLNDSHLAELSKYNGVLRKIHRAMAYHKSIFNSLLHASTNSFIKDNIHEFNDVYEHMERSESLSLMHQQLTADLVNSYLSVTSHRVNKIVKTLTIFTVLFVPLAFITGLYGMNFEYIPELRVKNGYFYVLGIMVLIEVALITFLRKLK